ncbi:lytic transglycosylase domain-containing protein [Paracoccus bogoriensis]|uniref:transglycosylase SLT domain-containing protein n=1 Tax=Paracoccus bogoriensis TaxID=242065 RepID=UPI001C685E48|nr:lytic transglycosylase domain-containing protein [Paracoccus bogoriensis]MBW7056385.1 lytic transglycosylase domain-containing protein [Paracoccus bogoriensis]
MSALTGPAGKPFPADRAAASDKGHASRLGRRGLVLGALALAACGGDSATSRSGLTHTGLYPNETPYLRQRINFWASHYDVPPALVQRVVLRESGHRPVARNGPYYGLMQLHPQTARTMGFRGPDTGLLDADTNLKYGVRYLRGAWIVADGNPDRAIMWYSRGYYYEARRRGLLRETGLRR